MISNASPVSIASALLLDAPGSTSSESLPSVGTNGGSSSRRRKGNPRKCPQSTLPLTIESPPCSSDSSNTSVGADDSGFSSSLNSLFSGFAPASTSDVHQQLHAVLQELEQNGQASTALSMLTSNPPTGLTATVSSASAPPPVAVNGFGPPSAKKPRVKAPRRQSEDPANVTLPEGFEAILEKARADGSSASNPHGLPPYAYTPRMDLNDNGMPLKRLRSNRSDTKITLQGPDGSIIEEQYDAEELQGFVKHFKILRNKYGFTQGDVGAALGRRYGADFSQTTISRFEALNLSYKNMCKLRPLLEEWLEEIDTALEAGTPVSDLLTRPLDSATTTSSTDSIKREPSDDQYSVSPDGHISPVVTAPAVVAKLGVAKIMPPLKKRRKRTNLDASQKLALDAYFVMNPRPDFTQITEIGHNLKLDNDVVRVWFCNRRQKMRRIDPLKSESPTPP